MGAEDESTRKIDVEALCGSLAASRGTQPLIDAVAVPKRESEGPPAPEGDEPESVTKLNAMGPIPADPREPRPTGSRAETLPSNEEVHALRAGMRSVREPEDDQKADSLRATVIYEAPIPPIAKAEPETTATYDLLALTRNGRVVHQGSAPEPGDAKLDPEGSVDIRFSMPSIDTSAFDDVDDPDDSRATALDELSVSSGAAPAPPTAPSRTPSPPEVDEAELIENGQFAELIGLYQTRFASIEGPNRRAAILVKIAHVYETHLDDANDALEVLLVAFELAPDNPDVVRALDRVAQRQQRVGEIADRVSVTLLPRAQDDKRSILLGHLVYWYERVLNRAREASVFVSELERHDKVHPILLKRAAQVAETNGDTKTQREYLERALERTIRDEEKVLLHLALAGAFAGTDNALKHYQAAFAIDPTSLVAIQGVKRLGEDKENYDQVKWALERQAEVAPTEAERLDALIELAELEESKFLKREAAAELLERVVAIDPSHPSALKGLERCYHALREWPKLGRVLRTRAAHTLDKESRVELLELAAEVYESKLNDAAGAADVYLELLETEPNHRRALADLARFYEKVGDFTNVATYKGRIAELAPTRRASSQELVKLGDMLSAPDRAPALAKLQYERAVEVDATNAAAWEALQRVAAEEGDDARVIACLEQRRDHTDVPRQRAMVLVELAQAYHARGDEASARKSLEDAILTDSSNESAAIAMLDVYTAEERWAEAVPLCELLVNAAIRDRDGEALFVRLRLATRIAAALGDPDRAMTSALAALSARPKDLGAQADLIAVASQCREAAAAATERAKDEILRIGAQEDGLPVEHLVHLAELQRHYGDLPGTAVTLESARRLAPDDKGLKAQLVDVYLAQGDFVRACKINVDIARSATSADERFKLLCDTGEIWSRRAKDPANAASVLEEARALRPLHPALLEMLAEVYRQLGDWPRLTGVLEDLIRVKERPDDRVKLLAAAAEIVRNRLGDRRRAAALLERIVDIDRRRVDVFEDLVRMLSDGADWKKVEHVYLRMIERVLDHDDADLRFDLFRKLGLLRRHHLGDAPRACEALGAALRIRPDDASARKEIVELFVLTDQLDNAVAHVRSALDRRPLDPALYGELYDLFLRQHAFDKAWCAVNVLRGLRELTAEQRRFQDDYRPMPLDRVPGQIGEEAWRSHIFHQELDFKLTNVLALLMPALTRVRQAQVLPEQRAGLPFSPSHSWMHQGILAVFANAAEILGVATPELLVGDVRSPLPFAPSSAWLGAIVVAAPAIERQATSLTFLVGKSLAERKLELAARSLVPSLSDLATLLTSAAHICRGETAKDPAAAALGESLSASLSPEEATALQTAILEAAEDSGPFDLKRWARAAELSAMRAGLLVAGDVAPARAAILADGAPTDRSPEERIGELYKFATSDLYADLRGAIGVAVAQ